MDLNFVKFKNNFINLVKKHWTYWKDMTKQKKEQKQPHNHRKTRSLSPKVKRLSYENNIKTTLKNVGYSQKDAENVWEALSVLAKHGIMVKI